MALGIPPELHKELVTRINGVDGKIELISPKQPL